MIMNAAFGFEVSLNMLLIAISVLLSAILAKGASPTCPPRTDLRPCTCVRVGEGRGASTVVTCVGLRDSAELHALLPTLRLLDLDVLHIADSFWGMGEGAMLPPEFASVALEWRVVDSHLAPCPFACPPRGGCEATLLTKLSLVNSTSASDRLCGKCDGGTQEWTACVGSNLRFLRLSEGVLKTVTADLFPKDMPSLQKLDLSRQRISKVDSLAFSHLKGLRVLDLSHNAIQYIHHVLRGEGALPVLEVLDLSYNLIQTLGLEFIPSLPRLKRLSLAHNALQAMKEEEWERKTKQLKNINLSGNPLHCDCSVKWVNASFPVTYEVQGKCASPKEFSESKLRQASRHLTERCTAAGIIGTRPPLFRKRKGDGITE